MEEINSIEGFEDIKDYLQEFFVGKLLKDEKASLENQISDSDVIYMLYYFTLSF